MGHGPSERVLLYGRPVTSAKLDTSMSISGTCQAVGFQATPDRRNNKDIQPLSTDGECLRKACCRA